jgi:hypothetical protein
MHNNRKRRFFLFPVFFILIFFILAAVIRGLWNAVLVDVVGVKPVSLWQAMGLLILSRLLVGGFKFGPPGNRPPFGGHASGGPNWREKWRNMSEEDRVRFREEWKRRFRGR